MLDNNVFSRVGDRVTSLLAEDAVAEAAPAPAPRTPSSDVMSREDFDRRIRETARSTGRTLAGGVNFIGLSKVREKLGARWEKLAARADEVARKAIERRLEPADVYTRQGELQYVVVFAHLTKEQAQVKCAVIAEEIMKRLLGEDIAPDLLEVKTAVTQADHHASDDTAPGIDALAAHLAAGGAADAPKPPADDWWDATDKADPLDSIRLVYRPLWDVRRNVVATNVCTPTATGSDGQLLLDEEEIAGLADPTTVNRLDLLMQRQVIGDLRHMMATGRKLLLCLPVHFETLASRAVSGTLPARHPGRWRASDRLRARGDAARRPAGPPAGAHRVPEAARPLRPAARAERPHAVPPSLGNRHLRARLYPPLRRLRTQRDRSHAAVCRQRQEGGSRRLYPRRA
jgi:hypothetical protein